jgi:histidyl-tRNA synthetase
MASVIEPKVLKGFRDFLPGAEISRRNIVEKIEKTCRAFGFVPIDTPALEYAEILLGKGGGETEKQIYRFTDNGGRDVALRFDLTVPFARFIALHQGDISLPFKRYHIAKVWRGENTQRGRYREFTQCDFDIVGCSGPAADFEILLLMRNTLSALGVELSIRVNHRGLFNRFLAHIGAAEKSVEILRAVDKLPKAGREETAQTLRELAGPEGAGKILEFTAGGEDFEETLDRMIRLSGGDSPESERLKILRRYMRDLGAEASFALDPSITRGLDYYTGVVFETFLTGLPGIGSICSGGRYDDLAGLYSKTKMCGVGASIGLDRLFAALESLDKIPGNGARAPAAVACLNEEQGGLYQALAEKIRGEGIPCEVFLEGAGDKQLVKQFVLAEKKGIKRLIIPGENFPQGPLALRDLEARQNREGLSAEEIIALLKEPPQEPFC